MAMTPGDRIRQAREDAKLSQKELAARFNLRRPSISNWERNKNLPRGTRLTKLAEILGVTTGWILSGAEGQDQAGAEVVNLSRLSKPVQIAGHRLGFPQDERIPLQFLDAQKIVVAEVLLDQDQIRDLIADLTKAYHP